MIKHLRTRLPRLGVIRLGIKERNAQGREFPRECDYFVVPDDLRRKLKDDKPKQLQVLFPSDDVDNVLIYDYIRYNGRLFGLKCDGERFLEIRDGQEVTGDCRKEEGKPCPCGAKAVARLNVIVLDGPLGVYQVVLGGETRIADLLTELRIYKTTFGRLTDILFTLERVPTEVQVRKQDGSRLARTGYPVRVRCSFSAKEAMLARGYDPRSLPGAGPASLPAAPPEHVEEDDDAAPDFHEDGVPEQPPLKTPAYALETVPQDAEFADEWTVERLFASAAELGVDATTYEHYVRGVYGVGPDDMTGKMIVAQRDYLQPALAASGPARQTAIKAITTVAAKMQARQKAGQ